MTRASEGGHFYAPNGTPVYEVPKKDGGMRPAHIGDARKLGLFPGVTSIIKCAAAPGLELWKQDQVLMAALTLPRIDGETNEQLCARIMHDSGEQARKARDKGTQIHAAIQGHYEGQAPSEEMWPYVKGVVETLKQNCANAQWKPEHPVAHPLGFGTKSDLHDFDYVLDFKGSDFGPDKAPKLKTWDEHAMQLAATRKALAHKGKVDVLAECGIVYVSRTHPGLCRLIWVDQDELQKGWQMFQGLHAYWCAKNNYFPSQLKVAA